MKYRFAEKTDFENGWPKYADDDVVLHLSDWNSNDRIGVIKASTLLWLVEHFGSNQKEFGPRLWDCCHGWVYQPRAQALDETHGFYVYQDWDKCGSYDELLELVNELSSEYGVKPLKPDVVYTTYKGHQDERWSE